ncbi:type I-MYXAN CRISPR-associated Cas8a1/Cmx1 [Chroogloeocystis siderophila]|uniref:Type I-MYXAN CRISPR-associated Cas8a1/Cmx1 n=1 Tax=Chroogloeocystis siderophila 5.2 s.c.1 TaxID=247279 RepID=A0A1U7HM83_9CHRO|nr:type I-MYXAN CRISPR-associated Cas8a1/Cmx1 [Chroogloeocystis siderophila]OKH24702.1 type I-MYXAN CRISPR-associated Cas8a1/Cmx1 [Chroogloeocystis siderophila 5.2 s.c.1]
MTLTLSIFDPNTLLPHRAGIAGLALALSVINPDDVPFAWEVTEDAVKLSWECSDKEAVLSLLQQTYRIQDGYLDVPALNLDPQGKYTFTEGVMTTFLQHGKQRKQLKESITLTFLIDEGQPEISQTFRPVEDCYYTGDFKEAFSSKGAFKSKIPLKGHHLPGLVECFAHGAYQESPQGFLSLVFLPLACSYYHLPGYRSAVVIPEVKNLQQWVRRRQNSVGRTYKNFRSSSSGESALRFLLQENLIQDNRQFRVNYCEVYQLGKQQWDGSQSYLKQAVYRVKVSDEILALYDSAFQFFKPQVRQNEKGETWLAISKILPWLCDNLIADKPWYSDFHTFYKQNELYERKGLVKMTQYLDTLEQTFFDAMQGAFSCYLREQHIQAQKQGRPLDYKQVTDKVINRLQRPSTQQDFAKTTVDFLSRHRSKATRGVGAEIYQWLHKDNQWKQARDLALLAIASYTGKGKDGQPEIPAEVLEDDSQVDTEFELLVS